jgi:hypothetical protein
VKAGAEKLLQESETKRSEKWIKHRPALSYEWDTKRGKLHIHQPSAGSYLIARPPQNAVVGP